VVTVSEAEIAAGVRLAAERSRLVVEPSGALGIAALALHAAEIGLDPRHVPVHAVVSGENVEPDRYREYLAAPIPREG
jgi:threonine dehydratase